MQIQTGKGTIPLFVLIGIWSISAVISLPGLAISPIFGDLDIIFKHASHLEIQLLSSLPNLLIIPFILLSGKLSESRDHIGILITGLSIFFVSGIFCFFAGNMTELILISCLIGIGAGMIIPLSTGLIATFFTGKYRVKQLGISSSVANISLVLATLFTGWVATINWHLPFIVYLIPGLSVLLIFSVRNYMSTAMNTSRNESQAGKGNAGTQQLVQRIRWVRLLPVMGLYLLACYVVLIIIFNLSFIIQDYRMSSTIAGTLISLLFLAIMLPGLFINNITGYLKEYTIVASFVSMAAGLALILVFPNVFLMVLGCVLAGFGYGTVQPYVYEKAVQTATSGKTILALAFVMAVNYVSIVITPFMITLVNDVFDEKNVKFPFTVNVIIALVFALLAWFWRKTFPLGPVDQGM
jgi:MFS family permease